MTVSITNFICTLHSPVAIVCHDAGAANLLIAWLRDWKKLGLLNEIKIQLYLKGPALISWNFEGLRLPHMEIYLDLNSAILGAKTVLSGTGWASDLEHQARKIARNLNITSVAVIDHWVNYQERFERYDEIILPDAILVSDQYAVEIARSIFKNIPIYKLPNIYLKDIVKLIPERKNNCLTLLYVLEPLRMDWGRGVSGEFQALDYFIENIRVIIGDKLIKLILRPHPSDPPDKYLEWIIRNKKFSPCLDNSQNLSDSISNANWVVGAETFAMVIAVASKRLTWSSLPPWSHRCRLPQKEIRHIRDEINN